MKVAPTGHTCVQGESAQWLHSLGTKKYLPSVIRGHRESFLAAVGRDDLGVGHMPVRDVVAFHPGAEESVRHVVLGLAGAHAVAAADALGDVDQHAPPMLGHLVVGRGFRGSGQHGLPRHGRRRQQNQHLTPGNIHFAPPASMPGLCGLWQVSQASPRSDLPAQPAESPWAWRRWPCGIARTARPCPAEQASPRPGRRHGG